MTDALAHVRFLWDGASSPGFFKKKFENDKFGGCSNFHNCGRNCGCGAQRSSAELGMALVSSA